jgi:hypothetical protein
MTPSRSTRRPASQSFAIFKSSVHGDSSIDLFFAKYFFANASSFFLLSLARDRRVTCRDRQRADRKRSLCRRFLRKLLDAACRRMNAHEQIVE